MSIKVTNGSNKLGWLDSVDESLQKLTVYLDIIFSDIESCPQETVDYLCETAGNYASYWLECAKVKILNGLRAQKKSVQDVIDQYAPLMKAIESIESPTPENIVGVVASIINVIKLIYKIIIKPYKEAIEFIVLLTTKIINISNSMQKLASYTPPKAPDINFRKFHIDFKPFSIRDIGATYPWPEPPKIQPFPNPFAKSAYMVSKLRKGNKVSGAESNTDNIV